MKTFRYIILFITLQVIFHMVAHYFSDIELSSKACFLDKCAIKEEQRILFITYRFVWFIHLLLFLWVVSYRAKIGLIAYGISGALIVALASHLSGSQFDLFLVFSGGGGLSLIYYLSFPRVKTKEGFPLWFVLGICSYVFLFPISWLLREVFLLEKEVSETWEFVLIIMSIMSVIAIPSSLAAIFAKPSQARVTKIAPPKTRKKKSSDRPVKEIIVSALYFGSLFISTEYAENRSPMVIFMPVLVFWLLLYPLLKNRSTVLKKVVFTFYVITFLLGFDAVIYQISDMLLKGDNFKIILADYVIIMVYLFLFPLFKTIPEYYLISKSEKKTFSEVFKSGLKNELIILLFILAKTNLNYYGF